MRLALALGFVGRRAMYRGDRSAVMSALDMAEWEALYKIEPWGPERGDMQAGIVARAVAAHGYARPSKLPGIGDYVLRFGRNEETAAHRDRRIAAAMERALKGSWCKRGNV